MSDSAASSTLTRRAPKEHPITHHPWSWQYLRLRLSAAVIRGVLGESEDVDANDSG